MTFGWDVVLTGLGSVACSIAYGVHAVLVAFG